LAEHGLTFIDRYGSPRAKPEATIESQSRIAALWTKYGDPEVAEWDEAAKEATGAAEATS